MILNSDKLFKVSINSFIKYEPSEKSWHNALYIAAYEFRSTLALHLLSENCTFGSDKQILNKDINYLLNVYRNLLN